MRKRFIKLGLAMFAMVLTGSVKAAELNSDGNLIKNGNFEQGLKNWYIPTWRKDVTVKPEIDDEISQGWGASSLKFVGIPGKIVFFEQRIKIPTGVKKLKLIAWIKTEKFNLLWVAPIRVHFSYKDDKNKTIYKNFGFATDYRKRSQDWTKFEMKFTVPAKFNSNVLFWITTSQCQNKHFDKAKGNSGTLWVDNITLSAVSDAPVEKKSK